MIKNVVINADDYGLSEHINTAVATLAQQKKLTSTSFMSLGNADQDSLSVLKQNDVSIGLHLDLTSNLTARTCQTINIKVNNLADLIVKAYLRKLPELALSQAIHKQLDRFEEQINQQPDFVDGHQHIHQLPQIRSTLLDCLKQRYANNLPAVRNTKSSMGGFKSLVIYKLGCAKLASLCQAQGLQQNKDFAGIYDFNLPADKLLRLWQKWLHKIHNNGLIMCHPASNGEFDDEIAKARYQEFLCISSERFMTLLQAENIQLVNWSCMNKHI